MCGMMKTLRFDTFIGAVRSRMKFRVATLAIATLLVGSAHAQSESVSLTLTPLADLATAGAHGTVWITEAYAHNHSDSILYINDIPECAIAVDLGCHIPIPPRGVVALHGISPVVPRRPYSIWHVMAGDPEALSITSLVRNVSDEVDPWGTALPTHAVFRSQPLQIGAVPADPEYRVSLRVYALDSGSDIPSVDVEFYSFERTVLVQPHLLGRTTMTAMPISHHMRATYFESHNVLGSLPHLDPDSRVVIKVAVPGSPSTLLWGFATITHNETQHVTVFAP